MYTTFSYRVDYFVCLFFTCAQFFGEICFLFLFSLSHLDETAGDLLKNTGSGWQPLHTYKTGVESRTSAETRVGEEADGELEGQLKLLQI